jgi:hypothetical protein
MTMGLRRFHRCGRTSATPKKRYAHILERQPDQLTTARLVNRHALKLTATACAACRETPRHHKPEVIRMTEQPRYAVFRGVRWAP